jgi:dynein heavy chain
MKLQQIIESKLNTNATKRFRPHNGKKGIIFIDDMNMPKKDEFGTQPPLELIRQYIEYGGWYDRSRLDNFVEIKDTDLICAMGPPGGGRTMISNRLTAKFHVLNLTLPSQLQIKRIFTSILNYNTQGFDGDEVRMHLEKVADVIIDCFNAIQASETFNPTLMKSHYLFNLRDMSRIIQGMSLIDKDSCDTTQMLLKLLVHEHLRVYRDRFINKTDRDELRKILDGLLFLHFQMSIGQILKEGEDEIDLTDNLIFVNFLDAGKVYSEVKSEKELKEMVDERLRDYNKKMKVPMDIVFFSDAIRNLCKINRILSLSNGHALLIGEGGSGRHSLAKMATYLAEYTTYQIQITKNYDQAQFKANMKSLFDNITSRNTTYTFVFSDNEILDEGIIEDVNNILGLGEIPNLYVKREGKDEFKDIRDRLRDKTKRETDEKIYDNFLSLIQQNLHIVFCMSQSGPNLRNLGRQYPGLINNTTQIWFNDWPKEALIQVATNYLENFVEVTEIPVVETEGQEEEEEEEEEEDDGSEDEEKKEERRRLKKEEKRREILSKLKTERVSAMANYFGNVHSRVIDMAQVMKTELRREVFITPKNFIDFVKEFKIFTEKKDEEVNKQLSKYTNGLDQLAKAQKDVAKLKEEMDIKDAEQKKKKKKLEILARDLKNDLKLVTNEQEKLKIKNDDILIKSKETEKLTAEARESEAKLQPIVEEAEKLVVELESKKSEFSIITGFVRTGNPAIVIKIMKALMVLMNEGTSTENILKVIGKNFVGKIKEINKDELTKDKPRFDKFEDLSKEIPVSLAGVSGAVEVLRKYMSAMGTLVKVKRDILPIQEEIAMLDKKLDNLRKEREELEAKLQSAEDRLKNSQKEETRTKDDLIVAEKEMVLMEARLERAQDLVKGLDSSKSSWEFNKQRLSEDLKKIDGDVLLSVAFMNYFGPFSSEYREKLNAFIISEVQKSKIVYTTTWEFVNFAGKEVEILNWTFKGLPSDQFSQENGVIVMNTTRWPLMVDPQNQANAWIKNLLGQDLIKADPQDKKLLAVMKECVQGGFVVLLEGIDEDIDPAIEPVLSKQLKNFEGKEFIMFGDQMIPFNHNFRLYITTRLNNPTYKPEISTKVTIVNFTVKEKGLEEQLLEALIKIMNEKLEQTRVESIKIKSESENKLKELEDEILRRLFENEGELVDNIELINTLKTSRETEETVKTQITNSASTLKKNQVARENYRPLGYIGSVLYFTIYHLNKVDPMYEFSLDSYVELFKKVVSARKDDKGNFGAANEVIKEKIGVIDVGLRKAVYDYACRSLFEKDKLLLSLQMAVNLAPIDERNNKDKGEDEEKKIRTKRTKTKGGEEDPEGQQKRESQYYAEFFKAEWNFFLKGGVVMNRDNQLSNPDQNWITQAMWDNITELENLPNFQGIAGSFTHTTKDWKRFYTSEQPELETLPSDWANKIKDFSMLPLLRAVRPDRLQFAIRIYVKKAIGDTFIKPPMFDMNAIHGDTNQFTPTIFILSPGAEPLTYLENLSI